MKKLALLLVCVLLTGLLFSLASGSVNLIGYIGQFVPDVVKRHAYLGGIFVLIMGLFIRAKLTGKNKDL